ncbi:hypothetical protein BKA70DRAFT_1418581 [Coprinopsis sp. MPI-PUGE-AT-0042]|nr:hypothetical protein BKA70DRAFT_1418581 [Coprinopsis sp. MPI-PUGE-AT-0042]
MDFTKLTNQKTSDSTVTTRQGIAGSSQLTASLSQLSGTKRNTKPKKTEVPTNTLYGYFEVAKPQAEATEPATSTKPGANGVSVDNAAALDTSEASIDATSAPDGPADGSLLHQAQGSEPNPSAGSMQHDPSQLSAKGSQFRSETLSSPGRIPCTPVDLDMDNENTSTRGIETPLTPGTTSAHIATKGHQRSQNSHEYPMRTVTRLVIKQDAAVPLALKLNVTGGMDLRVHVRVLKALPNGHCGVVTVEDSMRTGNEEGEGDERTPKRVRG